MGNELRVDMVNNSKESVKNDTIAVASIDEQIAGLTEKRDECLQMLNEIEVKLDTYLETIRSQKEDELNPGLQPTHPNYRPVFVEYTDPADPVHTWQLYYEEEQEGEETGVIIIVKVVIYSPTVNWDSDALITEYTQDWEYIDDLLYHPLTDLTGTFGIQPTLDMLGTAKNTMQSNINKLEALPDIFRRNLQ